MLALAGAADARSAGGGPLPDLTAAHVPSPPAAIAAGARFVERDVVANRGGSRAPASVAGYYLERGHHLTRLRLRHVPPLAPHHGSTALVALRAPARLATGSYRLVVCADVRHRVRESNERNNCRAARHVVRLKRPLPAPTTTPSAPSESPAPPAPSEPSASPAGPGGSALPAQVPVTLDSPLDGTVSATPTPPFSGHAAPGSLVTVQVEPQGGGAPVMTLQALPGPSGDWSVTPNSPGLADGSYSAQASQTDSFGRVASSPVRSFQVDTSAPALAIEQPPEGSATSDTTPAFSGTTNAPCSVQVTVFAGTGVDGAIVETASAAPSAGAWSVTPSLTLDDGDYTVEASQSDSHGNTAIVAHHFTVDTTAPALTIAQPADTSKTNDPTPAFGGATDEATAVHVTVSGPTPESFTATPSSGSWSANPATTLADGDYTVTASQADAIGNTRTVTSHFTIDTHVPALTIADPADGSTTNDTTPAIDGTTGASETAPVTVTIHQGTTATGATAGSPLTATPSGGNWSATPAAALAQGAYTAVATETGPGGTATAVTHFTVDTTAPSLAIAHPAGGSATNDTTPTIDGTTDDSAVVHLSIAGPVNATLTATPSAGGAWSATPSTALTQGSYTVTATETDAAGNTSTRSSSFTVDTTAPAPTIAHPATGTSGKDPTPTFDGATDGTTAVNVAVYAGNGTGGTLMETATATPASGSWSVTPATTLADGVYTAVASESDAAGNTGTATSHFTVDTAAPQLAIAHPVDGSTTNDITPAFSGTTDDAHTVHLSITGPLNETADATPSGGSWSTTPSTTLPEGSYTVTATQTDSAGNTATTTDHFKVDRTGPILTIAHPANDSSTNDTTPTFDGTTDDTRSIHLAVTGPVNESLDVTPASGAWSTTPTTTLTPGSYTVTATESDATGNTSTATNHFTIDTTAPVVTVAHPVNGSTGTDATPTFDGSANDSTTVQVTVKRGTTVVETATADPSGGSWTVTPSTTLAEATYTVEARQTDAAGNTGSASSQFTIAAATMLTAGDIGGCESGNDAAGTEALLAAEPNALVQTIGDNVYGNTHYADGTLADFQNCYGPNWGKEKARTKPAIGNHEYKDPGAAGYWDYFDGVGQNDGVAGVRGKGWYSYDLGAWHVVVLNANCDQVGCLQGSEQEVWLRNDLSAHPAQCTIAVWHQPLFTSDAYAGSETEMRTIWQDLYNAHTELVLNGHAHEYERFAPQSSTGHADSAGPREFVVGTGGESHSTFGTTAANSVVRDNTTFGVLQLTLRDGSYDWRFLPAAQPAAGGTFTDSGTAACQ